MSEYKSRHIQRLFDISTETVRTWSDEFADYLSPLANPGSGRHRLFNENDLKVFSLINDMKDKGLTYSDIHATLASGQRGELPELPLDDEVVEELAIAQYDMKLSIVVAERDNALADLQSAREQIIRLETELKNAEKANDDLDKARERIENLVKQVARLEVRLEIEQEKNTDKD